MICIQMHNNRTVRLIKGWMIKMKRIAMLYKIVMMFIRMIIKRKSQLKNIKIERANKKVNWNKDQIAAFLRGKYKEVKVI